MDLSSLLSTLAKTTFNHVKNLDVTDITEQIDGNEKKKENDVNIQQAKLWNKYKAYIEQRIGFIESSAQHNNNPVDKINLNDIH